MPLAFSQGHSPHPKIQFGPPLPLGYDGDAEYLDFETVGAGGPRGAARPARGRRPARASRCARLIRIPSRAARSSTSIALQVYRVVLPKERLPARRPGRLARRADHAGARAARRTASATASSRRATCGRWCTGAEIIGESGGAIELRLELRRVGDASARPDEVLRAAGGFPAGEEFWWRITRTANLVAGDNDTWHTPTDLPEGPTARSPSRVLRTVKEALHETGRKIGRLLGRSARPDLAKKFPRQLVVSSTPWEVRVALVEDGLPVEYLQEWRQNQGNAGSVYKGRVTKVLPGMQAAFVDIGQEKAGFLYISEISEELLDDGRGRRRRRRRAEAAGAAASRGQKIQDLLKADQEVMVQIAKESIGTKGARLTSHISLPGRYAGAHAHREPRRRLAAHLRRQGAPPAARDHPPPQAARATA